MNVSGAGEGNIRRDRGRPVTWAGTNVVACSSAQKTSSRGSAAQTHRRRISNGHQRRGKHGCWHHSKNRIITQAHQATGGDKRRTGISKHSKALGAENFA